MKKIMCVLCKNILKIEKDIISKKDFYGLICSKCAKKIGAKYSKDNKSYITNIIESEITD